MANVIFNGRIFANQTDMIEQGIVLKQYLAIHRIKFSAGDDELRAAVL